MRFRTRLTLVLLSVVIVSQLATGGAFLHATQSDIIAKGHQRLEVGANVFRQLLDARGEQLGNTIAILADDFGFKSAVSTQDTDTLYSVLANHGSRANADIVLLTDLEGNVLASSHHAPDTPMPFPQLFERANLNGSAASVVVVEGQPFEFALLPVRAPALIGWVGMGFLVGESITNEVKALTGLDASVITLQDEAISYLASSHPAQAAKPLVERSLEALKSGAYSIESQMTPDEATLAYTTTLYAGDIYQTHALLQLSRAELLGAYDSLWWQLLGIIALIVLFTLMVAAWSARSISQPLVALATAARRIGQGERVESLPGGSRHSETGQLAATLLTMQDEITRREATLHHRSRFDLLTELPNRVSAEEDLQRMIDAGAPFTLLLLAIDNFRDIKDTFGYAFGDHVLATLAKRLADLEGDATLAYRLDGNELLLARRQVQSDPVWRSQLLATLGQPIELESSPITPSLLIGEVNCPEHGDTVQLLMRRADVALDLARRQRATHRRYENGQDEQHQRQLTLIRDLQTAAANGELWMAYQPKVDTRTGRVNQCEALMRWQHPTLGFIPPDEFIGLAERSGSIGMLTQWMLSHICAQLHAWQQRGHSLAVAVNLSTSDVMEPLLAEQIAALLKRFDLTPRQLSVEVTESAVMQDVEIASKTLLELSRLGLSIAIDDYGTGYSSLAQIKRLPVNELKIDKSFVMALDTQPDDFTIVRSTIEMGHSLGLKLVAEGVENRASAELLSEIGCDYLQGYWIARPMASDALQSWLERFETLSLPSPGVSV
ncbi:putative bifunctional diguanylate cyclase/phosphodiesterase [Halomonas sp. HNIBRBA4712]|uniref:putative bifunctional diguanylate cyclase/phosphodiesterase n=1 Tax=Halomonas sp. HNIBRBA4712 TaxID=3373087 RepID=UPI003745DD87